MNAPRESATRSSASGAMTAEGPRTDVTLAALSERVHSTLDRLQAALAKLGGAEAPSQQFGDPAAGRALALISAGVEAPDVVRMETTALREHLLRLFCLFTTSASQSAAAHAAAPAAGMSASTVRMTALGFRKLVRSAQLTCERCTDVDVDLIYQQVVRTRGARMAPADMMMGLAMVGKRLYPEERTQSTAFHRLLSEQLLPWMLQLQHALASGSE